MISGGGAYDAGTVCAVICSELSKRVASNASYRAELAAPFLSVLADGCPAPLLYAIRVDSLEDARHVLVHATPADYQGMLVLDSHRNAIKMMSSSAARPLRDMNPAYDHRAGHQMAFRVEVKQHDVSGEYVVAAFAMGLKDAKYDPIMEIS